MAETPLSPESSSEGNPAGDFAEKVGGQEAGSPFPPTLEIVVEVSDGETAFHGADSPAAGPDTAGLIEAGGATFEAASAPASDQASGAEVPAQSTPEVAAPAGAGQAESLPMPEALAQEASWGATAPSPVAEVQLASPEPTPAAAASLAVSQPAAALEGVATTIAVPPLETAAGSTAEGGEWELLVGKVNAWFCSGELERQWQKLRGPLQGLAILVGLILALRLYATVVGTIDSIPLVSGLLELTGLIALGRFGLTKMIKTSERERVLALWKQRWQRFRG
jgi:hypothetical protein